MNSSSLFRSSLLAFALIIGSCALASILVDFNTPDASVFPSDPGKLSAFPLQQPPRWIDEIVPFRSDVQAHLALITALTALSSSAEGATADQAGELASAQAKVSQVLSLAPYNSELWLVLALLQARRDPRNPLLAEALKMSYFLAPSDAQLMPLRLDTATLFDALSDADLRELVRGDMRLMLTRQPRLRTAVASAYRRASNRGKAFIEDGALSIAPEFAAALRAPKQP